VIILGVQRLRVPELTEVRKMLGRGLQQRLVISHNLKLYSLAEALEVASDGDAILRALDRTFHGSEFARLDLRLTGALAAALEEVTIEHAQVSADGSGGVASLTFEHPLSPAKQVELRVGLFQDDRRIGTLALFRSAEGDRLYTDVRLIAQSVAPSLVDSLIRAAGASPEGLDLTGVS
jgi:hypothetical protein